MKFVNMEIDNMFQNSMSIPINNVLIPLRNEYTIVKLYLEYIQFDTYDTLIHAPANAICDNLFPINIFWL